MLNFTPTLNSNQIRQLRASFSFKSINQANPPFVKPVFNYKVIKTINITKPNVANLCQRQTKFNFVLVKYLKYFNNKSYDFLYMVKLIERFIEVYNSQTYFYKYVHLGVKDNAGRGMYIFSGQLVVLTWLYPGTRGGHWTQGQAPAHSQASCLACTHTS